MDVSRDDIRRIQRDAIWKWRWLGFKNSTPGFKASLAVIAFAVIGFAIHLLVIKTP